VLYGTEIIITSAAVGHATSMTSSLHFAA